MAAAASQLQLSSAARLASSGEIAYLNNRIWHLRG